MSAAPPPTLEDYRAEILERARDHSLDGARIGDADGFEAACRAIRRTANELESFTSDDVAWPVRGPELGAAFRSLAQAGEIVCVGYTTSRRPSSHGRVVRCWRRA